MHNQSKSDTCPIPGCNYHYATHAKLGWYKHVTSPAVHPHWNPDVTDPTARVNLFQKEFPHFIPGSGPFMRTDLKAIDGILRDLESLRVRVQALARTPLVRMPVIPREEPEESTGT